MRNDLSYKLDQEQSGIGLKERFLSSKALQFAAIGVTIAVAAVVSVPLGVCLTGDGRCGRSTSTRHIVGRSATLQLKRLARSRLNWSAACFGALFHNRHPHIQGNGHRSGSG